MNENASRPFGEIPRLPLGRALRRVASAARMRTDMLSRLRELHEHYGPIVTEIAFPFRMVNLAGPDANRLVLTDRERVFSAERPWTQIMGRIFPNGLLLKDGAEHRHHRKIMHLAFKRPALRTYAERMNPMIQARLDDWEFEEGPLSMFRAFKELTLDMASSIFLGEDPGPQSRAMNRAFENMVAASMSRVRLRIPGLEFTRGLEGREFMIRFLGDRIAKKRAADGTDMFTRLSVAVTADGERFGDDEVVDHMIFLMMAAHDTTTSTLCSMTWLLARHPEWQERVREESDRFGRDFVGLDDVDALPELGWVMKETLRRYPPLPVIPRVATSAFSFGGYRIPARTMVVISPIHTHHMPEWWEDPFRFDPERFSPGRQEHERHSHSRIPFGGGPHHCLGFRFAELQVKAVMHQMLRRVRWRVPEGYEMPVQQAPISKPIDGLPVRLESIG